MSNLTDLLRRLDVEPTPAVAARAEVEAHVRSIATADAREALRHFRDLVETSTDAAAVTAAFAAALSAETTATAAHAVVANLEQPLGRGMRRAIKADTEALWAAIAERFDEQAAKLTAAVQVVGPNPDKSAVAALGPIAQAAHADWLAAANALGYIVGVVREIIAANHGRTALQMSRFVDPECLNSVADIDRANSCQGGPAYGFAALIAAGFTLKLTTADEYAAAIERVRVAERDRQEERGGPLVDATPDDGFVRRVQ